MSVVLPVTVADTARMGERILAEVEQVIVGKRDAVEMVLLGVLASGHILIEDLPGLGKTLLARAMRESLEQVQLHPDLLEYVVALVAATRAHPQVTVGASPRGTLAVNQLARGHAALVGRDYVTPEDIKAVAVPALAHRLVLRPEMWVRQVTGEDVTGEVLASLPVPRSTP